MGDDGLRGVDCDRCDRLMGDDGGTWMASLSMRGQRFEDRKSKWGRAEALPCL
jgi:hypothetical protein